MKKFLTLSFVILGLAVIGIGGFVIFKKPVSLIPPGQKPPMEEIGKCGDNACDKFERTNPNICPADCSGKETPDEKKYKCPQYTPPDPSFYENCKNKGGTVKAGEKNEKGCQMPPQCVVSGKSLSSSSSSKTSSSPAISSSSSKSSSKPSTSTSAAESPFGFHAATPPTEAKNIGARWSRGFAAPYFFWSLVDPEKTGDSTKFQWEGETTGPTGQKFPLNYDVLFDASKYGINLLLNIDVQPEGTHRKTGSWLPTDEKSYKNFVKALVKRYSVVKYWQVGNEPNLINNQITGFGDLQRITYEAVKEADPSAKVLIAGLGGNNSVNTLNSDYYDSILKSLGGKYIDIFDIHFYGDAKGGVLNPTGSSEERLLGYREFKDVYNYYRNLLDKNGYSNTPIWVTEMGTFSGKIKERRGTQVYTLEQTEKEQAIDMIKRWVFPLSLGVKKIFWAFGLQEEVYGSWDDDFFDHTGFIYNGLDGVHKAGDKKLAYHTFKKMTETLEGSDWDNIETVQEKDKVYVYKFTKNGKPIWVAWNDNSGEKQVTISDIDSSSVKITEAVPNYESGKEVKDYNTAFKAETKQIANNKLTITLGETPMFVE